MDIRVTPPPQVPEEMSISVPGNIPNAAFWLGLAAATPGMRVHVKNVSLDPAGMAFVDLLVRMGARIREEVEAQKNGVWMGSLDIRGAGLKGVTVPPEMTQRLLEELPVLGVLAAVAGGKTTFTGLRDLPQPERNRLQALCRNLRLMHARVEEFDDGFSVEGNPSLQGAELECQGDARIAMGCALAGVLAQGETILKEAECVDEVYPGFFNEAPQGSFTPVGRS